MGEPDEDVLAWAFQSFAVILDETEEALYVGVLLKVNRQYVPHIVWSTATFLFSPAMPRPLRGLRGSKPARALHSTIALSASFVLRVRTIIFHSFSIG